MQRLYFFCANVSTVFAMRRARVSGRLASSMYFRYSFYRNFAIAFSEVAGALRYSVPPCRFSNWAMLLSPLCRATASGVLPS